MKPITIPNLNKEDTAKIKKIKLPVDNLNDTVKKTTKLTGVNINDAVEDKTPLPVENLNDVVGTKNKLEKLNINKPVIAKDTVSLPNINDAVTPNPNKLTNTPEPVKPLPTSGVGITNAILGVVNPIN